MSSQPPTATARTTTRSTPTGAPPIRHVAPATTPGAAGRRLRTAPIALVPPPGSVKPAPASDIDPITITFETVITDGTAERLCEIQLASFEPLAELAIQKQTGSRDELLDVFADPAFIKIVAWQRGLPVGLGVVTNAIDEIAEISPQFLRSKYPDHAARDAIYVGIYVTVAEQHRGVTLFSRISTEMWQIVAKAAGVLVYDVCEFNRAVFGADQLSLQLASAFPHSSVTTVDRQTWYVAELPEPIPGD